MHWNSKQDGQLCIAIDMDEVLVDTLGKMLDDYNLHFGTNVVPDDMHGTELADIVPDEHRPWVLRMLHQPGAFAALPPMPGSLEVMRQLCDQHRVYIASAALEFPDSFRDKIDWIARYVPQIPVERIIFCGEKFVLDVDYLLDDTPAHFEGMRGTGLLFDAPHNRTHTAHTRVHGWHNVLPAIAHHQALKHA